MKMSVWCFVTGISAALRVRPHPLPDSWLLGLELPDQSNRRAIVIVCGRESKILWESQSPLKLTRTPGLFLDDARITGGNWHLTTVSTAVKSDLAVSGSWRGGRFHTWFKELLMFSNEGGGQKPCNETPVRRYLALVHGHS